MTAKIFGREPAVLASTVEALLALLISFHALTFIGLNGQAELVVVMAVVNGALGLYVAYVTHDTLLGAAVALLKALVAFGAVYGLTLTSEQTGTLIAFLTVALGMYQRTQTGPSGRPSFDLTGDRHVTVPVRVVGDPHAVGDAIDAARKAPPAFGNE